MPEEFLFVSHVSEDRDAATQVVEELERRGLRCWIAPRNVRPGRPFDDEIASAIETCQAMLLIFSERCNDSEYIRREVTVAGESHKVVIPFRIENVEPKRGLRVRLSDLHWLDGFASREKAIDELISIFPAPSEPNEKAILESAGRATEGAKLRQPQRFWRRSGYGPMDSFRPQFQSKTTRKRKGSQATTSRPGPMGTARLTGAPSSSRATAASVTASTGKSETAPTMGSELSTAIRSPWTGVKALRSSIRWVPTASFTEPGTMGMPPKS
jgi:hypothetical protein